MTQSRKPLNLGVGAVAHGQQYAQQLTAVVGGVDLVGPGAGGRQHLVEGQPAPGPARPASSSGRWCSERAQTPAPLALSSPRPRRAGAPTGATHLVEQLAHLALGRGRLRGAESTGQQRLEGKRPL